VLFEKKVKNQKHPWGPTGTPLGIYTTLQMRNVVILVIFRFWTL